MRAIGLKCLSVFAVVVLIMLTLTACGDKTAPSAGNATYKDQVLTEDATAGIEGESTSHEVQKQRKIIENIDMTVQTKEFDKLIESINKQIAECGGYVESSSVSGRELDSNDNRYAEMKLRVPAEKSATFSEYISEKSVIIEKSVTTEDVTLKYVDMESRVSALEAEKESLERLLKEAATLSDIITVQDKLTEVIYEIESYKSQLRTYDNLVDYCTVSLFIKEVERTVVADKQSAWQQIGTNLKNNFEDVWNGTVAVFVFVVSAIPYLIIPAIVAAGALWIIFFTDRRAKRKESEKKTEE